MITLKHLMGSFPDFQSRGSRKSTYRQPQNVTANCLATQEEEDTRSSTEQAPLSKLGKVNTPLRRS